MLVKSLWRAPSTAGIRVTPMTKDARGDWSVSLDLPPGHHEFKFDVDGASCCEPGCDGHYDGCPKCTPNPYGTMNRVLEVQA